MKTVLLIVALLCTSCNLNTPNTNSKLSSDEQLANEITKKVAKKLQEKYELKPCGSGGQMTHEIKMLALSFFYYENVNINEARKLLVATINEFKDIINQDERIRPYLSNYPFESKNIQIRIIIKNSDGSKRKNESLCAISAIDNILEYQVREKQNMLMETIYEETYEEATQRIHSETNIKLEGR